MAQFKCFQWRCILVHCNDYTYYILFRQTSNGNSDPNSTKSRGSRVHMFHHRKVLSLDAETNTWIIWTKWINTMIIVFFSSIFCWKHHSLRCEWRHIFPSFSQKESHKICHQKNHQFTRSWKRQTKDFMISIRNSEICYNWKWWINTFSEDLEVWLYIYILQRQY